MNGAEVTINGELIALFIFLGVIAKALLNTHQNVKADNNTGAGVWVLIGVVVLLVWAGLGAPGVR